MSGGRGGLLEREAELERVEQALKRAAAGDGATVVVEGPPGAGKTSLLEAARASAEGLAVLTASGAPLEQGFAFGVVRQLLEPRLAGLDEAARGVFFAGAASLARPALEAPTGAVEPNALFPLLHGLHWLCANLAAEAPLAVIVDDVHWCDEPSAAFLAYLARRVNDLPVALLVAVRTTEVLGPEVEALRGKAAEVLRPPPLSERATTAIATAALGRAPDPAFARACREVTGGNPLHVRELLRGVAAEGLEPDAAAARRVQELAPAALARGVLVRLGRLAPPAPAVARALAVLGQTSVDDLAAVSEIEPNCAVDAVEALARADLVVAEERVRFVHPVIRAAVESDLSPARRTFLHAAAARVLQARAAPAEDVASHLLRCGPVGEEWAGDALREAGETALARAAPELAAERLARALQEPVGESGRWRVLRSLATAEFRAARPGAQQTYEKAIAAAPTTADRAKLTRAQASRLMADDRPAEACTLLERELETVPEHERECRLLLTADLLANALITPELAARYVPRFADTAPPHGDTPGERLLLAPLAMVRLFAGAPREEVADMARRAVAGGRLLQDEAPDAPAFGWAVMALRAAGATEEGDQAALLQLEDARRRGSPLGVAIASLALAGGPVLHRPVAEWEAHARTAVHAARLARWVAGLPAAVGIASAAHLERGELEDAEALFAAEGLTGEIPHQGLSNIALFHRGRLRVAQGRRREGSDDLLELGRRGGIAAVTLPWALEAAAALAALGDVAHAREVAERAAPGGLREYALALTDTGEERVPMLRHAVELLSRGSQFRTQTAALVELGSSLRRAGQRQEAREVLERAMEQAHRAGYAAMAHRAREELKVLGARPRRLAFSGLESLTASERRVAALAADGLSNPEIAQALFLSRKTVEMHLGRAYRKLGIGSRAALPEALREP